MKRLPTTNHAYFNFYLVFFTGLITAGWPMIVAAQSTKSSIPSNNTLGSPNSPVYSTTLLSDPVPPAPPPINNSITDSSTSLPSSNLQQPMPQLPEIPPFPKAGTNSPNTNPFTKVSKSIDLPSTGTALIPASGMPQSNNSLGQGPSDSSVTPSGNPNGNPTINTQNSISIPTNPTMPNAVQNPTQNSLTNPSSYSRINYGSTNLPSSAGNTPIPSAPSPTLNPSSTDTIPGGNSTKSIIPGSNALVPELGDPMAPVSNCSNCDVDSFRNWENMRGFPRIWWDMDFALMFLKPYSTPLLIQQYPSSALNGAFNPALAQTLFPTGQLNYDPFSGQRQTIGGWINQKRGIGIEFTVLSTSQQTQSQFFPSNNTFALGRPYFDVNANQPSMLLLSLPGQASANAQIQWSGYLRDLQLDLLKSGIVDEFWRVDWLAGIRYTEFNENLSINTNVYENATATLLGANDTFQTSNQFLGGQLGSRLTIQSNRWSVKLTGKLAYGIVHQNVMINGLTIASSNGSIIGTAPGNLLTQTSNIGNIWRDIDALIPEVNLRISYRVWRKLYLSLGYEFMAISSVVRPGAQIDTGVNPQLIPFTGQTSITGPNRPGMILQGSSFWAQGVTLGASWMY